MSGFDAQLMGTMPFAGSSGAHRGDQTMAALLLLSPVVATGLVLILQRIEQSISVADRPEFVGPGEPLP
jgi:hypothetical protein